jgi:hypothetical protein
MKSAVSTLSLALTCALLLCSPAAAAPGFSEVEAFHAYPLYYTGMEMDGLRLEAISKHEQVPDPRSTFWTFSYGTCEPPGAGSCDALLQVQSWSTCFRWAAGLHRKRELFNLRGTKAAGGSGRPERQPLEIFTGRTTVVLFSQTRSLAIAAARQLRTLSATEPPPLLPPPAPESLWGKLPCQHPRW